ncbi:tRNA adenosine(34) deaminase TadA [Neisseriaceae bacterium ESL0693]|nr:tRNA adenosine(34) deaminase TadA [Neisseriaceae bacterium ESL0693]
MTPLTTPPLPPKIIQKLHELDIDSIEALRQKGALTAFLLLKAAKLGVTDHLLWQLMALTENRHTSELTATEKAYWHTQLKQHPPVDCFPPLAQMQHWMGQALMQAQNALNAHEVPIGAVVVHNQTIIGQGFNQCITHHNISHHAEIQALADAGRYTQNYRLQQCDVYVTLEPCAMCASALIQARVRRVIYATTEKKSGAAGSVLNLFAQRSLNAHTAVLGGVLANESQQLLQQFFQAKRQHG